MDTIIKCPNCNTEIPVSDALAGQVRKDLEETLRAEHQKEIKEAKAEGEQQAKCEYELEIRDIKNQLGDKDEKLKEAQDNELKLRKRARNIEEREKNIDLEIRRKADAEVSQREEIIRKSASEENQLKLKEKDKTIQDLQKSLAELKRKSEQGSMETQGEVLEMHIEESLTSKFPFDVVKPVPKGVKGADIIQEVRNPSGEDCGTIVWEAKNTKNWSPGWIIKLKDDQRSVSANIAVLVSVAMPGDIRDFGMLDGIWVSGIESYLGLAIALREQLIGISFARSASIGKNEKMEMLYQYLSGDEFRHRIEAIVETFVTMQEQLNKEKRVTQKQWSEREKQIERITKNTVGMYGDMRGIIGASLPDIESLEVDDTKLLNRPDDKAHE